MIFTPDYVKARIGRKVEHLEVELVAQTGQEQRHETEHNHLQTAGTIAADRGVLNKAKAQRWFS